MVEVGRVADECLAVQAKERVRMSLPANTDMMHIDSADSLVEPSGAMLFQGDTVRYATPTCVAWRLVCLKSQCGGQVCC